MKTFQATCPYYIDIYRNMCYNIYVNLHTNTKETSLVNLFLFKEFTQMKHTGREMSQTVTTTEFPQGSTKLQSLMNQFQAQTGISKVSSSPNPLANVKVVNTIIHCPRIKRNICYSIFP